MSTTKIIDYVKNEVNSHELLIVVDRDGTIIKNDDFLGRNGDWRLELEYNDSVISFLSYLQTKFKTTKIVVSNQTGVARKLFDCSRVEEINQCVDAEMKQRGVKIVSWQYCPDADLDYVEIKKDEINFDYNFVKEKTKRKPNTLMVDDALKELGRQLSEFNKVVVVGNSDDDMGLAENLKAKYIDVVGKSYEELVKEIS